MRQHEIDLAMRQGFELLGQGEVVAKTVILRQIDQQIDVAGIRQVLVEECFCRRVSPGSSSPDWLSFHAGQKLPFFTSRRNADTVHLTLLVV